jgi:hypothetical protein
MDQCGRQREETRADGDVDRPARGGGAPTQTAIIAAAQTLRFPLKMGANDTEKSAKALVSDLNFSLG